MKQFSHLIHSHPLFIPLGEPETLGFSSQRDPGTPSILMSKGNAMQYSGVNHQQVKTKVGSVGYCERTRTEMSQAYCKSDYYNSPPKKLQM